MSTLFDTEGHIEHPDHAERSDTEFTLSTASLLGIFFGLVIICGVFFGFGYSIGRRSTDSKPENKAVTANATDTVANANPAKPSAIQEAPAPQDGSSQKASNPPASAPVTAVAEAPHAGQLKAIAPPATAAANPTVKAPGIASQPDIAAKPSAAKVLPAALPTRSAILEGVSAPRTSTSGAATDTLAPPPPTVVQIAAVSHQEDADVLIAALKKRGYNVAVHREPQDQLMHVQLGPFTNRDDAVAMRKKLLADGYNAIVKP